MPFQNCCLPLDAGRLFRSFRRQGISLYSLDSMIQRPAMASVPILLYHDLESAQCKSNKSTLPGVDTVVPLATFDRQLAYLSHHQYKSISLAEFFHLRKTSGDLRNKIVLTFDDGHKSNFELALDCLLRHGFRATFFVVSGNIDQGPHITSTQLKQMSELQMEIGSHGVTHTYLSQMDEARLHAEIDDSQKALADITGTSIDFFAFPGGHFNKAALRWLRASSYHGACSCYVGLNDSRTDPFLLRRIEIRRRTAPEFSFLSSSANLRFYTLLDRCKGALRFSVGLRNYCYLRNKCFSLYPFKR